MIAGNYMYPTETLKVSEPGNICSSGYFSQELQELQSAEDKVMSERPYLTFFSIIILFVSVSYAHYICNRSSRAYSSANPSIRLRGFNSTSCRAPLPRAGRWCAC